MWKDAEGAESAPRTDGSGCVPEASPPAVGTDAPISRGSVGGEGGGGWEEGEVSCFIEGVGEAWVVGEAGG